MHRIYIDNMPAHEGDDIRGSNSPDDSVFIEENRIIIHSECSVDGKEIEDAYNID